MSPSRGQKNRAVTNHSPMVSGLDADKKNLPSELHGKNIVLAPAVVDAVEDVDVALYAPQLLFRLARRVDELGLVGEGCKRGGYGHTHHGKAPQNE